VITASLPLGFEKSTGECAHRHHSRRIELVADIEASVKKASGRDY